LFESRYPAAGFDAVVTSAVVRYRRGTPEVTYILALRGSAGTVRLARDGDARAVRYLAEDVGRSLGRDVIAATEGQPVVRTAETLGQTLHAAARREEPAAPWRAIDYPAPPPGLKLDHGLTGRRAVF